MIWLGMRGSVVEYTGRIDAADPKVLVVSSTHPDAGVDTTGKQRFKLDVYA